MTKLGLPEKPILSVRTDKVGLPGKQFLSAIKPYLRTQVIWLFSDKLGLLERTPLCLQIMWSVGFSEEKPLYLREIHFICR